MLILTLFSLLALVYGQSDIAATVTSVMDWTVDPCADFYHFACGSWIKNTTLPPTKPQLTRSFTEILDFNQEILKDIVEDPSTGKLNTYYKSCMNMDPINQAGYGPIVDKLTLANKVSDADSLMSILAGFYLSNINPFFSFGPTIDPGNPDNVIASFDQGGLGMPYPSLYTGTDNGTVTIQKAYIAHLTQMFTLVEDPRPVDSATRVYALESTIAGFTVPPDDLTDPFATYNPMSWSAFSSLAPLNWAKYFNLLNVTMTGNVTVSVPTFFSNLTMTIVHNSPQTLKSYLMWNVIRASAPQLSQPFRDAYFAFYNKILGGQSQPEPLWRQCIAKTDGMLGELTGKYFLQKAFPGQSLDDATEDLKGIMDSMQSDIVNIPWMDSVTRDRALQKLSMVSKMIGGPSNPDDYSSVTINDNYYGNNQNIYVYENTQRLATIGGSSAAIRDEWDMTSATVNAYYDPTRNQMVFPAGILQQPFFNDSFPMEMNLGGIGMVMGHELTHGFDNQGRLYDGSGRLTNWWEPKTSQLFDQKVQCVIDQYSKFEPLPGVFVNGKLTQGENIADMGGIKNAFATAGTFLGDLTVPSIVPKLNKGQLFFVAFAQTWCTVASPESIKLRVKTDPHSPAQFRVLGPLMNLPAFSQVYNCPAGSPMNPVDRCQVW